MRSLPKRHVILNTHESALCRPKRPCSRFISFMLSFGLFAWAPACTHFTYLRCGCADQVFRGEVEAVNEAGGSADASRLEAWTLSAALLSRVLHRLFQLNAAYFKVGNGGCLFSLAVCRGCGRFNEGCTCA